MVRTRPTSAVTARETVKSAIGDTVPRAKLSPSGPALTFVFSFGNVWALALRFGVPHPVAPLIAHGHRRARSALSLPGRQPDHPT